MSLRSSIMLATTFLAIQPVVLAAAIHDADVWRRDALSNMTASLGSDARMCGMQAYNPVQVREKARCNAEVTK